MARLWAAVTTLDSWAEAYARHPKKVNVLPVGLGSRGEGENSSNPRTVKVLTALTKAYVLFCRCDDIKTALIVNLRNKTGTEHAQRLPRFPTRRLVRARSPNTGKS